MFYCCYHFMSPPVNNQLCALGTSNVTVKNYVDVIRILQNFFIGRWEGGIIEPHFVSGFLIVFGFIKSEN
jgi:hypothetical protein